MIFEHTCITILLAKSTLYISLPLLLLSRQIRAGFSVARGPSIHLFLPGHSDSLLSDMTYSRHTRKAYPGLFSLDV